MRITIKDHIRESRIFNERALIALVIVALLMLVIVARLFYLQILGHEHFTTLSEENRVNIVATPPARGYIYDRNGVVFAQNIPSFSLEIIPERVADIPATIDELGKLVQISEADAKRFYKQLQQNRPFNSIPLRVKLDDAEVARFATNRYRFPGVEIEARAIRNYPLQSLAAHVIGYVGRISEDELQQIDTVNYRATQYIGKIGIEKAYEDELHGQVGFSHIETNALGRPLRTLKTIPATGGQNIYLTIDAKMQRIAEDSLAGKRGAVVAVNPKNGEVLALASMPAFDPNLFVTGIDVQTYNNLEQSMDRPLFNRALKGQYPPGSTIKPFIGLAALERQKIDVGKRSFCPGWFSLEGEDHRYRDWKEEGHGHTNLEKAIVESCDVFFYELATNLGIDTIHEYLSQFGFGVRTGIDIRDEARGLLPSREWKRRNRQQPWYPGETVITGIGQGYTLTTPLQLAVATATLANRGTEFQPHLVYGMAAPETTAPTPYEVNIVRRVPILSQDNWDHIIRSMTRVVHSIHGTAYGISHRASFKMAGKTGTAQVFGIKQEEKYVAEEVAARLRDHALFIAFAPADDPEIAVAVIVENAGSGGSAAAPIARKLFDYQLAGEDPS